MPCPDAESEAQAILVAELANRGRFGEHSSRDSGSVHFRYFASVASRNAQAEAEPATPLPKREATVDGAFVRL